MRAGSLPTGNATWWIIIVSLVLTLILFIIPFPRNLQFGDAGEFLAVTATLGNAHPSGYPSYVLGARVASLPFSSLEGGLATLSILPMLLALVLLGATLAGWADSSRSDRPAYFGARGAGGIPVTLLVFLLLLRVALYPGIRFAATEIDVYSLNIFFSALLLYLVLRWERSSEVPVLLAIPYVYGLALTNHLSLSLWFPFLLWALWHLWRRCGAIRGILGGIFLFLLGLTPYLYLPLRHHGGAGISWVGLSSLGGVLSFLSREPYSGYTLARPMGLGFYQIREYFSLLLTESGVLLTLTGLLGMLWLFYTDRRKSVLFGGTFILSGICLALFVNFKPYDLQLVPVRQFFMPSLLLLTITALHPLLYLSVRRAALAWSIPALLLLDLFILPFGGDPNPPSERRICSRETGTEGMAEYLARKVVADLPEHAVLLPVTDHLTFPLWHLQMVKGDRRDVTVIQQNDIERQIESLEARFYMEDSVPQRSFLPSQVLTAEVLTVDAREEDADFGRLLHALGIEPPPLERLTSILFRLAARGIPVYIEPARGLEALAPYCIPEGALYRLSPVVGSGECNRGEVDMAGTRRFWTEIIDRLDKYPATGGGDINDRIAITFLLNETGCYLLKNGRISEAFWYFDRALGLCPCDELSMINLAGLRFMDGDPEGAREILRKVLSRNPYSALALENVGFVLDSLGDAIGAMANYRKALRCGNSSSSLLHRVADLHFRSGEYESALPYYEELFTDRPGAETRSGFRAGFIHQRAGRYARAGEMYRSVLDFDPGYGLCHLSLGSIYLGSNQVQEALYHFRRALEDSESVDGAKELINRLEANGV